MPSPSRFANITRRLEELPSDGGQAVDVLAGANLRIFIRLGELEEACKRLARRVAALERVPERADTASPPAKLFVNR